MRTFSANIFLRTTGIRKIRRGSGARTRSAAAAAAAVFDADVFRVERRVNYTVYYTTTAGRVVWFERYAVVATRVR